MKICLDVLPEADSPDAKGFVRLPCKRSIRARCKLYHCLDNLHYVAFLCRNWLSGYADFEIQKSLRAKRLFRASLRSNSSGCVTAVKPASRGCAGDQKLECIFQNDRQWQYCNPGNVRQTLSDTARFHTSRARSTQCRRTGNKWCLPCGYAHCRYRHIASRR